jgi:hypothetical protein
MRSLLEEEKNAQPRALYYYLGAITRGEKGTGKGKGLLIPEGAGEELEYWRELPTKEG